MLIFNKILSKIYNHKFYCGHTKYLNRLGGIMKLYNQPTKMEVLRTFSDKLGNQFELRGQKGMYSDEGCFKTNYLELHKKEKGSDKFVKINAKEEAYIDSYSGYKPSGIKREIFSNEGELLEKSEVFKTVSGSNISCKGKFLNMDGEMRIVNGEIRKIDLPKKINVDALETASNFAKRTLKQLAKLK